MSVIYPTSPAILPLDAGFTKKYYDYTGSETTDDNKKKEELITFIDASKTYTLTPTNNLQCEIFMVGGGGGGSTGSGGGGGIIHYTNYILKKNITYYIKVGNGGTGGNGGAGVNGGNSKISLTSSSSELLTAYGGGGGAYYNSVTSYSIKVGSGGGYGYKNPSKEYNDNNIEKKQGNIGSLYLLNGLYSYCGGQGGGKNGAGGLNIENGISYNPETSISRKIYGSGGKLYKLKKGLIYAKYTGYEVYDITPVRIDGNLYNIENDKIYNKWNSGNLFSILYKGYFYTQNYNGSFKFILYSDDASFLKINDTVVIDNGGLHGLLYKSGNIFLEAYTYNKIEIKFAQKYGGTALYFAFILPNNDQYTWNLNGFVFNDLNLDFENSVLNTGNGGMNAPYELIGANNFSDATTTIGKNGSDGIIYIKYKVNKGSIVNTNNNKILIEIFNNYLIDDDLKIYDFIKNNNYYDPVTIAKENYINYIYNSFIYLLNGSKLIISNKFSNGPNISEIISAGSTTTTNVKEFIITNKNRINFYILLMKNIYNQLYVYFSKNLNKLDKYNDISIIIFTINKETLLDNNTLTINIDSETKDAYISEDGISFENTYIITNEYKKDFNYKSLSIIDNDYGKSLKFFFKLNINLIFNLKKNNLINELLLLTSYYNILNYYYKLFDKLESTVSNLSYESTNYDVFIRNTLWGAYNASNYDSATNKITDSSGNDNYLTTSGTEFTYNGSTPIGNGALAIIPTISGTVNSIINFKSGIYLPSDFTICSITRYTSDIASRRKRILTSQFDTGINLLHGHWLDSRGAVYYNTWYYNGSKNNLKNWLVCCAKNRGIEPSNVLIDGFQRGIINQGPTIANNVNFGINILPQEKSDWSFSYLFIWDKLLSDDDMKIVSNILQQYLLDGIPININPNPSQDIINSYNDLDLIINDIVKDYKSLEIDANDNGYTIDNKTLSLLKETYTEDNEKLDSNILLLKNDRVKTNYKVDIYNTDYKEINKIKLESNILYIILFILSLIIIYIVILNIDNKLKIIYVGFIIIIIFLISIFIYYKYNKNNIVMENFTTTTESNILKSINEINNEINTYLSKLIIRLSTSDSISIYKQTNETLNIKKKYIENTTKDFNNKSNTVKESQNILRYNIIFNYNLNIFICNIIIISGLLYLFYLLIPSILNIIITIAIIFYIIIIVKFYMAIKSIGRTNTTKRYWIKPSNNTLKNL